jgi:hypothetical protein
MGAQTRLKLEIQKLQPLPHAEQRNRERERGDQRPRGVLPPAHRGGLLRRAAVFAIAKPERTSQLQPISPPADPFKDLVEGRLDAVVESARFRVCLSVCFSRFAITQNEGLVFCDVLVVETAESPILVRHVLICTDEGLNLWTFKKAVDVVVVAQEIRRKLFFFLLLPVFRRNRLKFLYESVAGIVARYAFSSIVDCLNSADGIIIYPGADVLRNVRCNRIETGFKQNTILEIVNSAGEAAVAQTNPAAEQLVAVERGIAFHAVDAVNSNLGIGKPVVEILAALNMDRLILISACPDVSIGRRIDMNIDIL